MKWICEVCKAINAELAFVCHNCGKDRPIDNGPHLVTDTTAGGKIGLSLKVGVLEETD